MIEVLIVSPQGVLFEGQAANAILPGEGGVFEVLPFHKPILSRLIGGIIIVGDKRFAIDRGVVQVKSNRVTAIIEPSAET